MKIYSLKFKQSLYIVFCILVFVFITLFLIFNSKQNLYVSQNIVEYWLSNLIPSLFPFMIFCEIVISTNIVSVISNFLRGFINKVFKLPSICSIPILMGYICGFPMGSKIVSEFYENKRISRKHAIQLLRFVNNANPVFIVASIGIGTFGNLTIGLVLLISHIISSIIIGIFITRSNDIIQESGEDLNRYIEKTNTGSLIRKSILSAFSTLISLLGYIIIFNLFSNFILRVFSIDNVFLRGIFEGIIEMTGGINTISKSNISGIFSITAVSFILGFSGICIIFQCYSCMGKIDIKFLEIVFCKLWHGILSAIITYVLLRYTHILNATSMAVNSNITNFDNFNLLPLDNPICYVIIGISLLFVVFSFFKIISYSIKRKAAK